jgi:hypothetical protein
VGLLRRSSALRLVASGVAVAALASGVWEGCSIYDSSLLLDAATPDDGGSDVVTPPPDAGDGCNHARWPARPTADDDASVQEIEFYNALSLLDFGTSDAGVAKGAAIGFDLDGICTCPGPDSCNSFADSGTQCDEEGGIDNSAGALIQEFSGSSNFFDQNYINGQLASGIFGALFRVRHYNGQANDTAVELSIYVSNGTEGAQSGTPSVPKGDGTDHWTIDPSSLLGGTIAPDGGPVPREAYDLNAYVSNYYLVGNISNMPLAIGAATGEGLVTIDLTGAIVVAKLEPVGNTFRATSGIVTGRWESKKLLTSLQVLHDPFDYDASLCGSDQIYGLLKSKICGLQDIASNVLDDGKGAPCNALSLAFAFQSVPATYGSVFAPDASTGGCGPLWTDQCGP